MLRQVGAAAKRIGILEVACLACLSFLRLVLLELQVGFAVVVVIQHTFQGWLSIVLFLVGNMGELLLATFRCTPNLRFRARRFEIIHACYLRYPRPVAKESNVTEVWSARGVELGEDSG